MTSDTPPKLCLGTFFVLVLTARKQRLKARAHYESQRDNLCDPDLLQALAQVVTPSYVLLDSKDISSIVHGLKSCRSSTINYMPFGKTQEIEEFSNRIRSDYGGQMKLMTEFTEKFLEIGTESKKDILLAAAIIEVIINDDGIGPNEEFYVTENGRPVKKADFANLTRVCLPAMLLGVLDYAVVHRKNNSIGRKTYEFWCPRRGYKNSKREYVGAMGNTFKNKISVYMPVRTEENMPGTDIVTPEIIEEKKTEAENPSQTQGGAPIAQTITNSEINIVNCEKNYDFKENKGTININS